jgi:hypothetical protein
MVDDILARRAIFGYAVTDDFVLGVSAGSPGTLSADAVKSLSVKSTLFLDMLHRAEPTHSNLSHGTKIALCRHGD